MNMTVAIRIFIFYFICLFVQKSLAALQCAESKKSSETCIVVDALPLDTSSRVNYRAMPSVGNGYLGTVVMSAEIHVSGVFNGRANVQPDSTNGRKSWGQKKDFEEKKRKRSTEGYYDHTHRARIPSTMAINFSLPLTGDRLFGIDFQHGVYYQWFTSPNVSIEQRIYAHRNLKNIAINEILVHANEDVVVTLLSLRGSESEDINFHNCNKQFGNDNELPYKVMFGQINETETENSEKVSVAVAWTKIPQYLTIKASQETQRYTFITSIATSLDCEDPAKIAVECYESAASDVDALFDSHSSEWESIWLNGNITVSDDLYLAQTIWASFYAILSSVREDWPHGLSPGSLSVSYEYLGHTFWDQDTWMYPPILMFAPEIAETLIQYRYKRLQAAMEIASKYNYTGAMYPWESALSGFEVCPEEVYGRNEIHITGDIAFAVYQYYMVSTDTRRTEWLKAYGFDIIYQTALFWSSRVVYNETKNAYVINDVMPPDEYHYPVNNSVYTNIVAQKNIRLAIKFGALLGKDIPEEWQEIADKMFIPFDETLGYHPEYEGFDITDPKSVVKQADTILIYFPLMFDASDARAKQNDLSYYGKITDVDGPAMTNSMFTIGWLDIENAESAYASFKKNFDNIQEPFKVWSEVQSGEGAVNFITAAGGYLQALIFGYGGIRLKDDDDKIHFDMKLLDTVEEIFWNGIKFRGVSIHFHRKGSNCDLAVHRNYGDRVVCAAYTKNNGVRHQEMLTFDRMPFSCNGTIHVQDNGVC